MDVKKIYTLFPQGHFVAGKIINFKRIRISDKLVHVVQVHEHLGTESQTTIYFYVEASKQAYEWKPCDFAYQNKATMPTKIDGEVVESLLKVAPVYNDAIQWQANTVFWRATEGELGADIQLNADMQICAPSGITESGEWLITQVNISPHDNGVEFEFMVSQMEKIPEDERQTQVPVGFDGEPLNVPRPTRQLLINYQFTKEKIVLSLF